MKKVLYCDFHPIGLNIMGEVGRFLGQLQQATGWTRLEIVQGRIVEGGVDLGPAPAHGGWLECLNEALNLARPDLVFIWFNDLIPHEWSCRDVSLLFDQAQEQMSAAPGSASYVRLNALPPALGPKHGTAFREITAAESYQCALPASIWKAQYLRALIGCSASVWTMEAHTHQAMALSTVEIHLPHYNLLLRGHCNAWAMRRLHKLTHSDWRDWCVTMPWMLKGFVSKTLQNVSPRVYHWIYKRLLRR
jgi:hypothetical protein